LGSSTWVIEKRGAQALAETGMLAEGECPPASVLVSGVEARLDRQSMVTGAVPV
jgi:hypothetical protein